MQEPIQLINSFTWFRGQPPQEDAIRWLDAQLTDQQRQEFGRRFRQKPPQVKVSMSPPLIQLELTWTGKRNSAGFRIFQLALTNNGTVIDAVAVLSGAGYTQAETFVRPEADWSGSGRCLPEGIYAIGRVEDSQLMRSSTSWGEGLGRYWISLDVLPQYQANNRSAFGLHADANASYSPGSAGCVCPFDNAGLKRILSWMNAKARPVQLVCDLQTGFLKQRGYQPILVAKHPEAVIASSDNSAAIMANPDVQRAAELLGIELTAVHKLLESN